MCPVHTQGEGWGEGGVYNYRGNVLMLDARNIYRKATRKIYDFSPEQLANLTAIVWLYRGQKDRFLGLVKDYVSNVCIEAVAIPGELDSFETALVELRGQLSDFADNIKNLDAILPEQQSALADALAVLSEAETAYNTDRASLVNGLTCFRSLYETAADRQPGPTQRQCSLRTAGQQSQGTGETDRSALQTCRPLCATGAGNGHCRRSR